MANKQVTTEEKDFLNLIASADLALDSDAIYAKIYAIEWLADFEGVEEFEDEAFRILMESGRSETQEKYEEFITPENQGKKEVAEALRDAIGRYSNIDDDEAPEKTVSVCDNGAAVPAKGFKPVSSVTAAELDKMELPPVMWLVEGLLPVGLAMISAPPKYYKSFMCLDLCVSICAGADFLGHKTNQHDCLYLDLESTKRRPQDRLNKICGTAQGKPDNLYIITGDQEVGFIGDGFEAQISAQLSQHPEIKLVVVDVVQLIRPEGRKAQTGYDRDYADYHALKRFADDHGICILLVTHNRKMKDQTDPFNEISGSAGTMGSLDCAWTITKEDRYAEDATLNVTGRDLEEKQFKIRYNKDRFRWEYIGTTDELEEQEAHFQYIHSPIIQTIEKLVDRGCGYWEGSTQDIKNASMYFDHKIFDDVRVVGRKIADYEAMLYFNGIQHIYDTSTRGKRIHKFTKIDVVDVVDVDDDVDVVDVEILG